MMPHLRDVAKRRASDREAVLEKSALLRMLPEQRQQGGRRLEVFLQFEKRLELIQHLPALQRSPFVHGRRR